MEDWVLLMKDRWCVLEVRAKVDARETVEDLSSAMKVVGTYYVVP